MNKKWLDNPVLVYGPRKSGTTLLQSLIDGGPDIFMLPEELKIEQSIRTEFAPKWDKIVTYLTIGRGLWRDINLFQFNAADRTVSYSAEHLANLRVGTLSFQEMQTVFDVNKYVSDLTRIRPHDITSTADIYRFELEAFYGSLHHKPDYKYWACKEVGTRPEVIASYFKALYPKAKTILIARSPHFIVRSIILDRRRKGIKLSFAKIIRYCYRAWGFLRFLPETRCWDDTLLVFYEDIVFNTEAVMRKICSFLDLQFNETYCLPTTMGINSVVTTSSVKTQKVFQAQVKSWTDQLRPKEVFALFLYTSFVKLWRHLRGSHHFSYEKLRTSFSNLSLDN